MEYDPTTTYRHTQNAAQWVVVVVSLFAIVMLSLAAAILQSEEGSVGIGIAVIAWIGFIYLAMLNFTRLTTTVTPGTIHLVWRLGWPTKTIQRATILEAHRHRNTWLNGWGVRWIKRGWMWNVWGLDAVQLELDTGRVFRIGTDDPDGLLAALDR